MRRVHLALHVRAVPASLLAGLLGIAAGCSHLDPPTMNDVAEQYVKLVLRVGQHDADFVDAYYGDPTWRPTGDPEPLDSLLAEAGATRRRLAAARPGRDADDLTMLRWAHLDRQLAAVESRLRMLTGESMSFDEESKQLYDAVAPHRTEADFQDALDQLDSLLPGTGPLTTRYAAFREDYVIPPDRLDRVFRAAIDGCRARTAEHLELPEGERFTIEYVTGQAWSAYNWYQGHYTSVIQVNSDLPVTIDRALDLACHEGYPGHHVYSVMLEKHLVRDRGWTEYSVYPLFSPQSLIAEGTANYGIEVAFPGDERTAFERDVLYPEAGLDPATADRYAAVQHAVDRLRYADNEAARRYLEGTMDRAETIAWLERWASMTRDRAEQRTRFIDRYRSYVINYTLGRDLVRDYVEQRVGAADEHPTHWVVFGRLLASPRLPSGLQ